MLGDDGLPSFDQLRYRRREASVILVAFDLIELTVTICAVIRFEKCPLPSI